MFLCGFGLLFHWMMGGPLNEHAPAAPAAPGSSFLTGRAAPASTACAARPPRSVFDLFTRSPKEALFAGFLFFRWPRSFPFSLPAPSFRRSPKEAPLHQMCFQRNLKSAEEMRRLASRSISGNMPGTFEKKNACHPLTSASLPKNACALPHRGEGSETCNGKLAAAVSMIVSLVRRDENRVCPAPHHHLHVITWRAPALSHDHLRCLMIPWRVAFGQGIVIIRCSPLA